MVLIERISDAGTDRAVPQSPEDKTVRPVWLIEAGVYGSEIDSLVREIRHQGMIAELLPHQSLTSGGFAASLSQQFASGACIIAYGTYPFARQIQLHFKWTPGAWCNSESVACTTYYAYFGKYLLNQQYAIMPGVEAIRQRDWIFSVFGVDDRVFARPSGCHKLFVGRGIFRAEFDAALSPTRYDPATLVLVAKPKAIGKEWRLIASGDRVITGSQYAEGGSRSIARGCPSGVRDFAESMLREVYWRPDPIFMLDVCESAGQLWLVELNGFSCSWLYQCDVAAVVREASDLAAQQWTRDRSQEAGPKMSAEQVDERGVLTAPDRR
jgi:hypothetical protein